MLTRILAGIGGGASDPLAGMSWEWRFEADSITGLADTDPVATWPDTSGNSRDATQATEAYRPTWDADAFGTIGGVHVSAANSNLTTAAITALTQPTTVWSVGGIATDFTYLYDGLTSSARHSLLRSTNAAAHAGATLASTASITTAQVVAVVFNGVSGLIYVGGGTAAASGDVGSHSLTGLTIGSRYSATGQPGSPIGAVLAINEAQSTSDMNIVGNYLADKFSLSWTNI